MKILSWTGRGINSLRPSIFDCIVLGGLGITYLSDRFIQGSFFIFYSVFIISLTILLKQKRQYISIPLGLLMIWCFAMIFTHFDYKYVDDAIISSWFNIAHLAGKFIYIFIGILLFISIIRYSTNLRLLWIMLPIILIPILKVNAIGGRLTLPASIITSIIIYAWLKGKRLIAVLLGVIMGALALSIWPWVVLKFSCRPYIWIELLRQIGEHPLIGSGFSRALQPENMIWVRKIGDITQGWLCRHNDILSIGAYFGVLASLLTIWFTVGLLKKTLKTIYFIPALTITLMANFQMTMFEPNKAYVCLVILAVCIKETMEKTYV